jgi:uncharacterized protein YhjY with autotransporter beta-barrel domain
MPTFISDFRRSSFAPAAIGMMLVTADAGAQLVDPDSQNAAQLSMGEATLAMCPTLGLRRDDPDFTQSDDEAQLNGFCDALAGGNFEDTNAVLQRVNGEEMQNVQSHFSEMRSGHVRTLMTRMAALASGAESGPGIDVSGLSIGAGDGTMLGDVDWQRLGIFVRGNLLFGEKDPTGEAEGFDFTTDGITFGADYRLTEKLTVGGAFGLSRFDVDYDVTENALIGQDQKSKGFTISAYGSYAATTRLFLSAVVSGGKSEYKSPRRLVALSTGADPELDDVDTTLKSKFDAVHYGAAVHAIYDAALIAGVRVTPTGRLDYSKAKFDGTRETENGDSGAALRFSSQQAESLTSQLGVELSRNFRTGFGTIVPSLRATYIHELLGKDDGVKVRYANDPTRLSEFELRTEARDHHYAALGANIALTLGNGLVLFADYGTIQGLKNYDFQGVTLGLQTSLGDSR